MRLKAFTPFGIPVLWVRHPGVRHFGTAFGVPGFGIQACSRSNKRVGFVGEISFCVVLWTANVTSDRYEAVKDD